MKNFFIKSLNGMAFGLFSSLIVGLILKQIGTLFNIEFLTYLGGFSQLLMGAGIGIDPPASLALAIGTIPLATAPALPPEEPPVFRDGSVGFPAGPNNLESVIFLVPSSG